MKNSGSSLKDFRVHRGQVYEDNKTQAPAIERPVPNQQVAHRDQSLSEWSSRKMDSNLEQMWQEWGEDLSDTDVSLDLSKPQSTKVAQSRSAPKNDKPEPVHQEQYQSARGPVQSSYQKQISENLGAHEDSFSVALALEERRMERDGVVDFSNTYRKQELLKLHTVEYAQKIQSLFRRELEIFNEARRSASSSIQLYKVSKTEADFMLFRNGVKLIVSASQSGRIQFAFNQYLGQVLAPTHAPQMEIEARWGALDQLVWTFKGDKIEAMDLVRYFMTEFVKQSYR